MEITEFGPTFLNWTLLISKDPRTTISLKRLKKKKLFLQKIENHGRSKINIGNVARHREYC